MTCANPPALIVTSRVEFIVSVALIRCTSQKTANLEAYVQ